MTILPLGNMVALAWILGPCTGVSVHPLQPIVSATPTVSTLPVGYGNAITWGSIARANGHRVDMNPAVGSIAWFSAGVNGAGHMGHVAWVAEVRGDQVTIEEYNYDAGQGPEKYHKRSFHKSQVSGYIHFKDLEPGAQNGNPTNSSIKVGDTVRFTGTFRVTSIVRK